MQTTSIWLTLHQILSRIRRDILHMQTTSICLTLHYILSRIRTRRDTLHRGEGYVLYNIHYIVLLICIEEELIKGSSQQCRFTQNNPHWNIWRKISYITIKILEILSRICSITSLHCKNSFSINSNYLSL